MSAPHGNSAASQAWATSPAGIDYALQRINSVAGGLHGLPAISAISRRFERPADPASEIADAAHRYGIADVGLPTVATGSAPRPAAPSAAAGLSGPTGPTGLERLLASTIGQTNQSFGLGGGGGGLAALLLSHMGGR